MDVGLDGWCKGNGLRQKIEKVKKREKENDLAYRPWKIENVC